jgi:hypothetical protein
MSFAQRDPGIEVFGEALVDQVEIDAGIHEPRIMPTEMTAYGRSADATALLCSTSKFHQTAADRIDELPVF